MNIYSLAGVLSSTNRTKFYLKGKHCKQNAIAFAARNTKKKKRKRRKK